MRTYGNIHVYISVYNKENGIIILCLCGSPARRRVGGGLCVATSSCSTHTHTFVRIRSRHAFSVLPPEPPCGIDFRPKLVNNFDEQHSFRLSVRETGKFQGTRVASATPPNVGTDFGTQDLTQCCPTFLYIGDHLTDGCGGAGAVWRLQ
jgi:hypothetical protein